MPLNANDQTQMNDLDFLIGNVELVDEDIKKWVADNPNKEKALLEDNSLNSKKYKEISHEDLDRRQKLLHEKEEHALRKQHLNFLSKITIYWLGFITVLSWLQGFKGIFLVSIHIKPEYLEKLPIHFSLVKFELTNPAFIALITTTTATILGLYTIAAIWLYKGKQEDNKQKADTENSSDEEK
jgi:hypothetical protein